MDDGSPAPNTLLGHRRPLTDAERMDWLRLIRSENVGPVTFYHLLRYFGSAGAALDALPELSRRGGRKRPVRLCPVDQAEREMGAARKAGARLLAAVEPDYPEPLAATEDAPPVIAVKGDAALLARPAVGMVGARNASANGKRFAERFARDLGDAGFVVASGLARGIDAAAHRGALATGTVALVAGGVDVCYPPENRDLYEAIAERGAIVSEQPAGLEPQGRHFPRRNRLISGVSRGVVVVEAARRSGSLITARMALEQGREVFAVPGSPLDPRARGSNDLIRQGATLTEEAEDVLRTLDPTLAPAAKRASVPAPQTVVTVDANLSDARRRVEENLSPTPTGVDELVRECHMPPSAVAAVLLELELAGRIERHPGNRVARLDG